MRNTVSNGHGKRNPLVMASTASERSSTLSWQMSMIESSGGGVGEVCGGVGDEVCGAVCCEVCGAVCCEVCSGVSGVLEVGGEVGGMLEVDTHTRTG